MLVLATLFAGSAEGDPALIPTPSDLDRLRSLIARAPDPMDARRFLDELMRRPTLPRCQQPVADLKCFCLAAPGMPRCSADSNVVPAK